MTAEQLHGAEREQVWQQIITASPRFAQYQVKTDRELPVIRLVPRSGEQSLPLLCRSIDGWIGRNPEQDRSWPTD